MDTSRNNALDDAPECVMCGSKWVSGRIVVADARRRSEQRFAWFCRSCDAVWTEPIESVGAVPDAMRD